MKYEHHSHCFNDKSEIMNLISKNDSITIGLVSSLLLHDVDVDCGEEILQGVDARRQPVLFRH